MGTVRRGLAWTGKARKVLGPRVWCGLARQEEAGMGVDGPGLARTGPVGMGTVGRGAERVDVGRSGVARKS